MTCFIFIGSSQSVTKNVTKALVRFFNEYAKNSKDLTAAAKLVQSFKYDRFNEETVCVVSPGIVLTHYPTVIKNLRGIFPFPIISKNYFYIGPVHARDNTIN